MMQDLSKRNDWISYILDFSYSLLPELARLFLFFYQASRMN